MKTFSLLSLLLATTVLCGCNAESPTDASATSETRATVDTWLPLSVGDKAIEAQLAMTPREQQQGLMRRESMGENQGMLFVFPRPKQQSFWMENTPLPLDIAYISPDGVIREIYRMQPYDTSSIVSHSRDIQLVLEMNQNWFPKNGVQVGDKLDMEKVKAAIRQRGYAPAKLGLK